MTRRLAVPLLAVGLALVLSGCLAIPITVDEDGSQPGPLAKVTVTTSICDFPISDGPSEECPDREELIEWLDDCVCGGGNMSLPHQITVGLRVPKGAIAPETITAEDVEFVSFDTLILRKAARALRRGNKARAQRLLVSDEPDTATGDVVFHRSPELEDAMVEFYEEGGLPIRAATRGFVPGAGDLLDDDQQLVTYVSESVPGMMLEQLDLEATFGLPRNGNQPYAGPFNHTSFVGWRVAVPHELVEGTSEEMFSDARPIVCEEPSGPEQAIEDGICPIPGPFTSEEGIDLDTQDLTIAGGDPVTVEAGKTATVPFKLRTAGLAGKDVHLAADAPIADATVTPQQTVWPFQATGEYDMPVTVQVPDYAPPGEYEVRLVASNLGETREAVAKLVVTPKIIPAVELPPIPVDEPTLITPDNLYYRSGGVHFGYICAADPADCQDSAAELWVEPSNLTARRAARAADTVWDAVKTYELAGFKKFRARKDERVERQARAFQRARRALRSGRTLRGVLVIRSGGKPTQIRRVLIRVKRPT